VRVTSPAAIARALVKVMAYARYRSRIEETLFSQDAQQEQFGIAGRVSTGFASYAASPSLFRDLIGASFPHPFDSHPQLEARLAAISAPIVPSRYPQVVTAPVRESWLSDIDGAAEIERQMWEAYEARFAAAHEEALAWRLTPATPEEQAIVEKYFPAEKIVSKDNTTLDVTFARIVFSEWGAPVTFDTITGCEIRESFGRKFLTIQLNSVERKKVEIPLHRFTDADAVVAVFNRYLSRHTFMTQHQTESARRSA
jgi:hypothetical protein